MGSTRYRRLRSEALEACENRGHRMNLFSILKNEQRFTRELVFSGWLGIRDINAVSKCLDCGMEVQILTCPRPNEIEIGGAAVAQNCLMTKRRNDEEAAKGN